MHLPIFSVRSEVGTATAPIWPPGGYAARMSEWDVIIIGGGVAGLSCGITLASAQGKPWFGDRRILIIDDGRSDVNKAMLNNAPGVIPGTSGKQALGLMRQQLGQYAAATLENGLVHRLRRRSANRFEVFLEGQATYEGVRVVLATGYKQCRVEGLPVEPVPHPRGGKPGRIMLAHDGFFQLEIGIHVAGLLAGGSSQFAIAAGIGAQVAVDILSEWANKRTHVHDATS